MRVLVTGGAGFIGSRYVRTLLAGGYPTYAADRAKGRSGEIFNIGGGEPTVTRYRENRARWEPLKPAELTR